MVISQGLNCGVSFGMNLPGVELGYSINQNAHFGVNYIPKYGSELHSFTNFMGGYFRKSFDQKEIKSSSTFYRFYLVCNLGVLKTEIPEKISYDFLGSTNFTKDPSVIKNEIGGFVGGGFELIGSSLVFPIEFGYGKMPNLWSSLSSFQESNNNIKTTSNFYFNIGLRKYFGDY